MRKVIGEILKLVWKLFKVVFWKWLKPLLGRVALIGALIVAAVVMAVLVFGRC